MTQKSPLCVRITTGSGVEFASYVVLEQIEAFGLRRLDFPMLCHTLPASSSVDGVLGLNFLRGKRLTIDFRKGLVTLK